MINKEQRAYGWCTELNDVCTALLNNKQDLHDWQVHLIHSFVRFGNKQGYLTYKQMRVLGGISKDVLHGGEYKYHDWWDGTIQNIMFDKNVLNTNPEVLPNELVTASEFRQRFNEKLEERESLRFSNVEDECN